MTSDAVNQHKRDKSDEGRQLSPEPCWMRLSATGRRKRPQTTRTHGEIAPDSGSSARPGTRAALGPRGVSSRAGNKKCLVGRTGFEPVTSSVSGKRSPTELTARVPRRDATRAGTPPRDASRDADDASPATTPQADDRVHCRTRRSRCRVGSAQQRQAPATAYSASSVCGSPNHSITTLSTKRVIAEIRPPSRVNTIIPCPPNTGSCSSCM